MVPYGYDCGPKFSWSSCLFAVAIVVIPAILALAVVIIQVAC
jgi:hypothetical protein